MCIRDSSYDDPGVWEALGAKFGSDVYFVTHTWMGSAEGHPDMPEFVKLYTDYHGSAPDTAFVATGWDTVMLFAQAAEIAGTTDGAAVAKALEENEFNLLSNPNFEHYYELANFYKDNEYYAKSIKYYSLVLKEIKKDHFLVPKILDRRGTSFERLGNWENAERDLMESLKILPNQPHVLNYLAYSWIDKGINLDEGLEMLKKATKLREDDGYIIDSLGWAYYAKKNYIEAAFYLQRAVELLPMDPIINDHYADALWMLNKNIQARYFWNHILKLDGTEPVSYTHLTLPTNREV